MKKEEITDKTKELVEYLVSQHDISTVTSLVKLCYLIDLTSLKAGDGPISNFKYIRWHFGPYDKRIDSVLQDLTSDGKIKPELDYTNSGIEYVKYKTAENSDYKELSEKDLSHIDAVLASLKGYGPKALTLVAYKTKPMTTIGATLGGDQHMGEELNMMAK